MLQAFGIHWVMSGSVAGLLSCWHPWLGKHNLDIWNLVPGCLMWIVWLERNHCSFEDNEKTLDELKVLCQRSLLEWSRCWGFTNCSSLSEFMSSLSLVSIFFFFSLSLFYYKFLITCQKKREELIQIPTFFAHATPIQNNNTFLPELVSK